MMTGIREKRQFLNRQLIESQRLKELVSGHPLMGSLFSQRNEEVRQELKLLPKGGSEPRTVLFFAGDPVYGTRGIDAQFASMILSPFLEMVKTEYSSEKHGRVGERGPRKDEDEARLMLTGLPRGSFGIELSQPHTENLFAEEQLSDVLVRLTELLSSAGKTDEEFIHVLKDVSPRVHGRLTEFFKVLNDSRASIRMQTGDMEIEIDQEHISEAYNRVSSVEVTEDTINIDGVFRGATLDTGKFDFRPDNGEPISGTISTELDEDQVAKMFPLTNQACVAQVKETQVTVQSGIVRTRYELIGLTPKK